MSERAATNQAAGIQPAVIVIAILVTAVIGILAAISFVGGEADRARAQWQVALGSVADAQDRAVERWLQEQFAVMRRLTDNQALQLYVSLITQPEPAMEAEQEAQQGYLQQLLDATAETAGFAQGGGPRLPDSNSRPAGTGGLALLDRTGKAIVATSGLPPLDDAVQRFLNDTPLSRPALMDVFAAADGTPLIGFVAPIYGVQGDGSDASIVGRVMGIRPLAPVFAELVEPPGQQTQTSESYLVRPKGEGFELLSPLRDGSQPLAKSLAGGAQANAAAFAAANPNGFDSRTDHQVRAVLVTGRPIADTSWTLVRQVTEAEALGPVRDRLRTVLVVLILLVIGVVAAMLALWRHGASRRYAQLAHENRVAADRFAALNSFLSLVTDSLPVELHYLDRDNRYVFGNRATARALGIAQEDLRGKTLASVLGPARAAPIEAAAAGVFETGIPTQVELRTEVNGHKRIETVEVVAVKGDEVHAPGVLVVVDDVTALEAERERAEAASTRLVGVLTGILDARDVNAAGHSGRTAEVAEAIAQELGLEREQVEGAAMTGRLANIGRVFLPEEVLNKRGELTPGEAQVVDAAFAQAADLVESIAFHQPIGTALRQLRERADGTGQPNGLKGEEILALAQIAQVASAFIAMTSPRPWRAAMGPQQASAALLAQSDRSYSRKVVLALLNVLENRGGRSRWAAWLGDD
ncbi:HD domain-containing phosphohydrolase [Zavarzinia sp. CC-PAN008]|uniref:HD domain-containing phosphohydrolase n=1 Tax=Zavarzinia sp. CC-PAN008 TaxID=3243332 RepID=UPI003F742406